MTSFVQQLGVFAQSYPKVIRTSVLLTLIGTVSLAMYKLNPSSESEDQTVVPVAEIKQPEIMVQPQAITTPQLPSTQTQIIILTPTNQAELDCLKFGGGLGCFDGNYQPDLPQHWADEKKEEPKRGEPRNVGIYKFW